MIHQENAQAATALGTAFTYQGRLLVSLAPPNTPHDFQFALFDSAAGGVQVAGPVTNANVAVSNGVFTTKIDFGEAAYNGDKRFLQIAVRPAGSGAFTTLSGRQEITPAPYAIYALNVGNVSGTVTCAKRKYYLTTSVPTGATADTACTAGYHFASFAEIMDPSNLEYAMDLVTNGIAHSLPDSGKGPPFSSLGFVRIGVTGANNMVAGNANCISGGVPWSSSSASIFGTAIALKPTWQDSPSNISPWDAIVRSCDNVGAPQTHAWCVQDL
jgi:hypothetical protein